jgi:hypothetical protein
MAGHTTNDGTGFTGSPTQITNDTALYSALTSSRYTGLVSRQSGVLLIKAILTSPAVQGHLQQGACSVPGLQLFILLRHGRDARRQHGVYLSGLVYCQQDGFLRRSRFQLPVSIRVRMISWKLTPCSDGIPLVNRAEDCPFEPSVDCLS